MAAAVVLWAARVILIPLCAAAFLAVMLWPVQRWLSRRIGRLAAAVIVGAAMFAAAGAIAAGVGMIAGSAGEQLAGSVQRLKESVGSIRSWLQQHHVPGAARLVPDRLPQDAVVRATEFAASGLHGLVEFVAATALALFLTALALWEAPCWSSRLERLLGPERARTVSGAFAEASHDFVRYIGATTVSGLAAGALTAGLCWLVGVPMAPLWGLLSFLFNYIPNIGFYISGVPPTVLAIAEGGVGSGLMMVAGLVAIEFVTGRLLATALIGRAMGLSPLTVMVAVLVWAFLWGAAGALLAAPISVAMVIALRRWGPTHRVAGALVSDRGSGPVR